MRNKNKYLPKYLVSHWNKELSNYEIIYFTNKKLAIKGVNWLKKHTKFYDNITLSKIKRKWNFYGLRGWIELYRGEKL